MFKWSIIYDIISLKTYVLITCKIILIYRIAIWLPAKVICFLYKKAKSQSLIYISYIRVKFKVWVVIKKPICVYKSTCKRPGTKTQVFENNIYITVIQQIINKLHWIQNFLFNQPLIVIYLLLLKTNIMTSVGMRM